jgi:tetratricopeptide (TPR) repeat protein
VGRGRRGGSGEGDLEADDSPIDRLIAVLEAAPAGLHDLDDASGDVPLEWPITMSDVYLAFDGARLFHEELILYPAAHVIRDENGRWQIGDLGGNAIQVDGRGRVWRTDEESGEDVVDGTSLPKWLRGQIEALSLLFDKDGEYGEDVFDDEGEISADLARAQVRAQVKRDPKAPGPRWRLARALAAAGEVDAARAELESVVEVAPELPWAWLDLARLSESLGELDGAYDEAVAAAEAAPGHEQVAYFWAHAARLAVRRKNDADRARCAARAVDADPRIVEAQLAGAEQNLADGDVESARALVELARAVAPRDLTAIDLARRIDAADPTN